MSCLIGYKYVIQAGDTLEKIALEHLGNSAQWEDIRKADGTPFTQADAAALQVGQEVCIPEKQNLPHPSNLQFWDIVSLEFYEGMFPDRANLYRYENLIEAIKTYPKFCAEGSDEQRKREAAAFLAHIAHETGMLKHVEEEKRENWSHYCDSSISAYPCAENQTYHGRGPIQLSWNYNYGALGKALGIDLLNNPELLKTDGVVAFQSALWFWMEPQFPKPSIHEVILGIWQPSPEDEALGRIPGFGLTINIINGGVECGPKNAENHDKVHNRIALYKKLVQLFGIEDENNLSCELMTPYS